MAATSASSAAAPEPSGAITNESALNGDETVPVRGSSGVTFRVVVLCLGLAFLFGYMIPIVDLYMHNTFLGAAHLPPGAIAVLLVMLLIVNPALKMLSKRGGFSRNEILTVYITTLFSCLVPGHGSENFFISNIIGPFYFAKPENQWLDFLHRLPSWFTPALWAGHGKFDEAGKLVVQDWYVAGPIPWTAWLVPLMMWGSFIFASYLMLACLGVMLRAQWAEREALAFPLLRLPLELTEDVDRPDYLGVIGRFFRNPLMWCGFGIGVFIELLKGLHVYYADVPDVPLEINTGSLFTEAPWNQIGWTPMQLYPIAIGITYLLTSEISFSLWFFYWFMRLQLMIAFTLGFLPNTLPALVGHTAGARAFIGYQQIGAYLAYVALVLWTGREHFGHVARRAFGRERARESEKREALSYPLAFWGFVFAFVFMIAWSCAAGISLGIALAMWSLYLVIAIALTRLVVEGGLLFVQQAWTPLGAIAQITGSGPGTILPASSIVPASFLQGAIITDLRAFLLPSFVQSFKLAHDRKIKARPLLALIMTCVLITLVMGIWMNVRMGYEKGGLSLDPWFAQGGAQTPANTSNDLIKGARDVSHWNLIWLAVGGLLTFGMMFARTRFLWFPLHPLGFLMSVTYPMNRLWFSVFLGWLAKVTIQRFGGSDTYRRLVAAFLGLALGDVAMMIFWLLIDAWQIRMGHNLMPT